MTVYLLDGSVIIPLAAPEHVHHQRTRRWFAAIDAFALCPISEGALVRYMIREGLSQQAVAATLGGFHGNPNCQFWPDSLSYSQTNLARVRGHRQVTDAYLVALAASHSDALLATLDEGLAATYPGLTILVPPP